MTGVSVVIVGSGPAGFYAADSLRARIADCRIDIIERLPTPFGLVRAGVAPDHLSTKNVTRVFEKVLDRPNVRFLGNVSLGRDVSYRELKSLYDIVVLAFGAHQARPLAVAGDNLAGVVDVVDFVGWYNGVPGARDCGEDVRAARAAAVIGNGNVALDVARLLAKTADELGDSDIVPAAAHAIAAAPISDIYVIGRRGPVQASFTHPELSELGKLAEAVPVVDPSVLPADASAADEAGRGKKQRNLDTLRAFAEAKPAKAPVRVHLRFFAAPEAVLGSERVRALRLARTRIQEGRAVPTGETEELGVDLVVPAIGYRVVPVPGVPLDARRGTVTNRDGHVEDNVYVVGWARRGPTGVVGTNRVDAREVVARIAALEPTGGKPGPEGLDRLLKERGVRPVTAADWRRIDAAERAHARGGRPREKLLQVEDMLAVLSAPAA